MDVPSRRVQRSSTKKRSRPLAARSKRSSNKKATKKKKYKPTKSGEAKKQKLKDPSGGG